MKQFKHILVSVDTNSDLHPAIEWAIQIGKPGHSKLTLVDVQRELGWPARLVLRDYQLVMDHERERKAERLQSLVEGLRHRGFDVSSKVLSGGATSTEITKEVIRGGFDLVVRVSRGAHSLRAGFFGSTTSRLFRTCPCSVLAVDPDAYPHYERVLAAVDPCPSDAGHAQLNDAIMVHAKSLADLVKTRPIIVHAWSMLGANLIYSRMSAAEYEQSVGQVREEVEKAFNKFLEWHDLSLESDNVHLLDGGAELAIPKYVEEHNIDVIVMGTIARTGVPGLIMGNTAERILGAVRCTILALKPDNFQSPIAHDG